MRGRFLLFCLLIHSFFAAFGQFKLPEWEVGMSSAAHLGDNAPFWLFSNHQGKYLPTGFAASAELLLFSKNDNSKKVDYEYGLELYGRFGESDDVWVHQAYGGLIFYDLFRIRGGMWHETVGSILPEISSGSIIWSGNARPMPKVEIGIPEYAMLPFTWDLVEIKGLISHGWFEDGRYASNVWLHHKNAYVRIGGSLPVNLYYGLNHYAMWGGSSPRHEEPYPADFESFLRVFFIRSANPGHPGSPPGWVNNKIGNHIASRNHGINFSRETYTLGVFLQDIVEDGSGWRRRNYPDGLWGIWFRLNDNQKPLQAVTYEYLQTTLQSGPEYRENGEVVGGRDNYFNHGVYQSGWSYYRYTIGTPLISSPILNDPSVFSFTNNRVRAHHLGLMGQLGQDVSCRALFTYSRNYGTYSRPFDKRKDQFSGMVELTTPIGFFDLEASVAITADLGNMYGNNIGLMLRLVRKGSFGK